jgi:hypothetical protein
VEPDQRGAAGGVDAELARGRHHVPGVVAGQPEQLLHQAAVRRRRRGQPRQHPRRQHGPAAQHVLGVVGQRLGSLLQPDGARKPGRATIAGRGQVDAHGEPRPQAQFGAFGDAHHVAAGAQRVEDAPLADPLEVLRRPGAAEDRQPPQLVGLGIGGGVRQHVRGGILDADQAAGAVGDGLGQREKVCAAR